MFSPVTLLQSISILLVDDHPMIHDGIKSMLNRVGTHCKYGCIIHEAYSGHEALGKIEHEDFDIILMDYQLRGISGAETTRLALDKKPHLKILAMSGYSEFTYLKKMVDAGVKGFVLKDVLAEELFKAIETILKGGSYFSPIIGHNLVETLVRIPYFSAHNKYEQLNSSSRVAECQVRLTLREKEITKHMFCLIPNEQIAKLMKISKRTVERHQCNMYDKFKVKNKMEFIEYVIRKKLL